MLCVQEEGRTEAVLNLSEWEHSAHSEMYERPVHLSGDRDQLQVQLLNLNLHSYKNKNKITEMTNPNMMGLTGSKISPANQIIFEDHLRHTLAKGTGKPYKQRDETLVKPIKDSAFGNFPKDYKLKKAK